MTFATITNLLLMGVCGVSIAQTMRLSKQVRDIRSASLKASVELLDNATDRAKMVLLDLKRLLTQDVAALGKTMATGESLRDELAVMIGIGNSVADRIVEAVEASKSPERKETQEAKKPRRTGKKSAAAVKTIAAVATEIAKDAAKAPRAASPRSRRSRSSAVAKGRPTLVVVPEVTADTPVAGHA